MSATDKKSLYEDLKDLFGKKAAEVDETDDESDAGDAGQKGDSPDPDDDAGQKQPDGDDDASPVEDLVMALADELDADPEELMAAIDAAAKESDGEDDEDDDDDDDVGQDADDGDTVTIDFAKKAEEHGLVTEETLDAKLSDLRDDVGEKLQETLEESVDEIGQKMRETSTPNPAAGSFQDAEDFDSHLERITAGSGWTNSDGGE